MKTDLPPDPLKFFRTDQPWIDQLEKLATARPIDRRWIQVEQQQKDKWR
jgi:hypothetical protein